LRPNHPGQILSQGRSTEIIQTSSSWSEERMSNKVRLVAALLLLLCLMPARSFAQQAAVTSALARFREKLSPMKMSDDEKAGLADLLKRAEDAIKANHLFLSLLRLQSLWARLGAQEYVESSAAIAKHGEAAFESNWRKLGKELADKERRIAPAGIRQLPAVVRAFVQSSRHQSHAYYQSGLLYGQQTTLDNGHFYMGLARGYVDFSLFCLSLRFEAAPAVLRMRALDNELSELEGEILKAYGQSDAKDQPSYNNLNSTLKVAQELNQSKMIEGALQKYLESAWLFGLITATDASKDALPAIKAKVESARQRLGERGKDHSIGSLYLEIADAALAAAGAEVSADNLKRASVVVDTVLPRYFKYVSEVK
jgi:hypothetical protein